MHGNSIRIGFQGDRSTQQRWLHCGFNFPDQDMGFERRKVGWYPDLPRSRFTPLEAMIGLLAKHPDVQSLAVRPYRIGVLLRNVRSLEQTWQEIEQVALAEELVCSKRTGWLWSTTQCRLEVIDVAGTGCLRPQVHTGKVELAQAGISGSVSSRRGFGEWEWISLIDAEKLGPNDIKVMRRLIKISGLVQFDFHGGKYGRLRYLASPVFDLVDLDRQVQKALGALCLQTTPAVAESS